MVNNGINHGIKNGINNGIIWLVVTGTMEFWMTFHNIWEFHHPNWRTHIFQRGRSTTNQLFINSLWSIWIPAASISILAENHHQMCHDWEFHSKIDTFLEVWMGKSWKIRKSSTWYSSLSVKYPIFFLLVDQSPAWQSNMAMKPPWLVRGCPN